MPNSYAGFDGSDGKLHTRYSELAKCTAGQINSVIAYKLGMDDPIVTEAMAFGTERHDFFEREARAFSHLPQVFKGMPATKGVTIDVVEKEFKVELVRGVVVHSQPDAVSYGHKTIFDFKTVTDSGQGVDKKVAAYWSSQQLPFYAMILAIHGIEITQAVYLCEIWNADRDKILGHRQVVREIRPEQIERVGDWAKQRIALLKVAMQQAKEVMA